MRALCLALALCCVSYAAADITADDLKTSDLKFTGRDYYLAEKENTLEVETAEFTVAGVTDTDVAKGAFYVGDTKQEKTEDTLKNGVHTVKESLTVGKDDVASLSPITYRVFKEGEETTVLAESAPFIPEVLDPKTDKPVSEDIKHKDCEVTFNMEGIYSNPPLRSFCGFKQEGKFLDDHSDAKLVEGKTSFDSNRHDDAAGANSKWEKVDFTQEGTTDANYKAWKLTEAKLNVNEATEGKALSASCKIWWDEHDFTEYEGAEVPVKLCGANPLKAVAESDSYKDTTKYEAVQTAKNCWDKDFHTNAKMTCTGEGKTDNSYTVYCKDGEYMAHTGSEDKAEAYDEAKATAWADETCGTAGILPMTLLVGALALFASRA